MNRIRGTAFGRFPLFCGISGGLHAIVPGRDAQLLFECHLEMFIPLLLFLHSPGEIPVCFLNAL